MSESAPVRRRRVFKVRRRCMLARLHSDAQVSIGNEKECVKSESYLEGGVMSPLYRCV